MGRKSLPGVGMRNLVIAVAGPRLDTDTRESWLRRAARLAGSSYRQAKSLFYGEISDPYHPTVTKFKEAAGRYEAENLAARFEDLAHSLELRDADFHQPDVAALLGAARNLRGLDRAGITPTGTLEQGGTIVANRGPHPGPLQDRRRCLAHSPGSNPQAGKNAAAGEEPRAGAPDGAPAGASKD